MPRRKRARFSAIAVAAVSLMLVAAACSSSNDNSGGGSSSGAAPNGVPLTGAGSTFAEPVYTQWAKDFLSIESGAKINYQAIGSGGGVEQFTAQTVDFGASDAPLQPDETAKLPGTAVEFPTMLGGVAIAYNVQGVKNGLKLDGTTTADIFLGKVTKWNDPEIAKLNPGVTLPDTNITVVHRSDESGTTFVWTGWLSEESPTWKKQVGADTAVQWPTGIGGDGSDGVAAALSQTDGSIGYISFDFAVASNLSVATVQRDDGQWVAPSVDSISKAGGGLKFPIKPDTNILNSPTAGAYPISSTTYLLVYTDQKSQEKGQTLVDFLTWGLTTGQGDLSKLNYSPLPSKIAKGALEQLGQIQYNGSTIQASSVVGS
jgi:phosphate transport system substrate-binding protein